MNPAGGVEEICRVLETEFGWSFPDHRMQEVADAAWAALQEANLADMDALVQALADGGNGRSRILGVLARRLSVSETCFFRDALVFRLLEQKVLPAIVQRRASPGRLRIWSAGCCTGEETYSLAIALLRCLPEGEPWDFEVLGTDLNPVSIECAERGIYGIWAFRDAPSWLRKTFFTAADAGRFQVKPEVRSKVRFLRHNLMEGLPPAVEPGQIDLLFCRNVLMYFSAERSGGIIRALRSALAHDGVLCVAPYESLRLRSSGFEPADHVGGAFFQPQGRSRMGASSRILPPEASPLTRRRAERPLRRRLVERRRLRRPETAARPDASAVILADPLREVRTLAGEGRLWEALDCCDQLVAHDGLDPEAHYLRATILLEGGLTDEAAGALRQTLYLRPDFVQAHLAMATVARKLGRHREAGRLIARVRQLLSSRPPEEPVAASEGLTAAALLAMLPAATAVS